MFRIYLGRTFVLVCLFSAQESIAASRPEKKCEELLVSRNPVTAFFRHHLEVYRLKKQLESAENEVTGAVNILKFRQEALSQGVARKSYQMSFEERKITEGHLRAQFGSDGLERALELLRRVLAGEVETFSADDRELLLLVTLYKISEYKMAFWDEAWSYTAHEAAVAQYRVAQSKLRVVIARFLLLKNHKEMQSSVADLEKKMALALNVAAKAREDFDESIEACLHVEQLLKRISMASAEAGALIRRYGVVWDIYRKDGTLAGEERL